MSIIEVPRDGNCLLHSIALAYLTSSKTGEILAHKFSQLVGSHSSVLLEFVHESLTNHNNYFNFLLSSSIWQTIVNTFRKKLMEFMAGREEHFLFNEINLDGFIPGNSSFYNKTTFNEYLLEVKKPGVWLGSLEIQAACSLLNIVVIVYDANNLKTLAKFGNIYEQNSAEIQLCFDRGPPSHYNPKIDFVKKSIKRKLYADDDEAITLKVAQFYDSYVKRKKAKVLIENEINLPINQKNYPESPDINNDSDDYMEVDVDQENVQLKDQKEDYSASGLKRSLHGTIYQVQLLMLFAHRGKEMFDYRLATEMDDAEKFDDVVFQYQETKDSPWKVRFLQAKHKQDIEKHKVTVKELSSTKDDDFSIHKYFISFCKIQNNKKFDNLIQEDFAICTNTYLDIELGEKRQYKNILHEKEFWRSLFQNVENLENDNILYFIEESETHKEYKFKQDTNTINTIAKKLQEILEKRIRETKNNCDEYLKKLLISKFLGDSLKNDIKRYITTNNLIDITGTLIYEVLNIEESISKVKGKLRAGLYTYPSELINLAEKILLIKDLPDLLLENFDFKNIKKKSPEHKIAYLKIIKKQFMKAITSIKNLQNWLTCEDAEDSEKEKTKIADLTFALNNINNYIPEFLNKFRIIVEYPNETNLNKLINEEIGEKFDLMNASLVCHSFERQMWNWIKEKKGKYILKHNCQDMFDDIKLQVNTLITSGISRTYPEYLKTIFVKFNKESSEITTFLNDPLQKIFHLETDYPQLGSLKIYQTIEHQLMQSEDFCIFLKLDTLMLPAIEKISLDSFTHAKSDKLFIIECQDLNQNFSGIKVLCQKLSNALRKSSETKRKLILISNNKHYLPKYFNKLINSSYSLHKNIFSNIQDSCQDHLLNLSLNFQGKKIKLGDIVGKSLAGNFLSGEIITSILHNKIISIDTEKNPINSFFKKAYYIPRKLHYQEINSSILKEKRVFFISDINEDELIKMGPGPSDIYNISNDLNKTEPACKVLLSCIQNDNSKNKQLFRKICKTYKNQSLVWLKHLNGKFYLIENNAYSNYFHDYLVKEDVVESNCFIEESDTLYLDDKTVLVSECPGMGKSTLLDSVSYNIKQKSPAAWVTKIRLLDFGTSNHECSLDNITFNHNDVKAAIKFCVSMILFNNNRSASKTFFENILYFGLNSSQHDIKIYILFDGFDEICPNYKEKVVNLIKALQLSNVHQIWITTRTHMKNDLENELKCQAFTLNHWVDEENKIDFLCKYWKYDLKRDELNFKVIVEKINMLLKNTQWYPKNVEDLLKKLHEQIENLNNNLYQDPQILQKCINDLDFVGFALVVLAKWNNCLPDTQKSVTSVPLHLKMFAKLIFYHLEIVLLDFNLFDFFQKFVKLKIAIYQKSKRIFTDFIGADTEQISSSTNLENIHRALAARLFLPQYDNLNLPGSETIQSETSVFRTQYQFERKQKEYAEEVENRKIHFKYRLARVGLLQINSLENFTFIHQSFGEFFLCKWLAEHINHELVQTILFRLILLDSDYSLTQTLFEQYLLMYYSLNAPLQQVELKQSLLQELIDHETETYMNETILHVAVKNEYIHTAFFILEKFKMFDGMFKNNYLDKFLSVADRSQQTALESAAFTGKYKSFSFLVHYYSYSSFLSSCISVIKHDFVPEFNILLVIVQYIKFNNFNDLPKFLLTQIIRRDIAATKIYSAYTLLHLLIRLKNYRGVKLIIQEIGLEKNVLKKIVCSTTNHSTTTLNMAVDKECFDEAWAILDGIRGYPDIIKTLFLKQDIYGQTILMLIRDNADFLDQVLAYIAKEVPDQFHLILKELILTPTNAGATIFKYKHTCKKVFEYFKNDFDLLVDFTLITLYQINFSSEKRKQILKIIQCNYLNIFSDKNTLNQFESIKETIDQVQVDTKKLLTLCQNKCLNELIALTENWSTIHFKQVILAAKVNKFTFFITLFDKESLKILDFLLNKIKNFFITKAIILNADEENGTIFHMAVKKGFTDLFQNLLVYLHKTPFLTSVILKPDKQQRVISHVITESATQTFASLLLTKLDEDTVEDLISNPLHTSDRTYTPLELSVVYNNAKIFKPIYSFLTKEDKGNINIKELLHLAVTNGSIDILQELLKVFSNRNLFCFTNGSIIFQLLSDTSEQNNPGVTNLLVSELKDNLGKEEEVLKQCLLHKNQHNETILHRICHPNVCAKNMQLLINFLSSEKEIFRQLLLAKDDMNRTPFYLAVFYEIKEVVLLLLNLMKDNNDLNTAKQLLLTSEDDDLTPLLCSSQKGNKLIFNYIYDFSCNVLKETFPYIIEKQVLHQDIQGQTILHKLIRNISTTNDAHSELYGTFLNSMRHNPDILIRLVLTTDYSGRTILHPLWYDAVHVSALKMLLSIVNKEVVRKLLLKEDIYGITALQMAYWESEEDEYVQFLISMLTEHVLDVENILNNLRKAPAIRNELHTAIDNFNFNKIENILGGYTNCLKEIFFEDDHISSIINLLVKKDNTKLVEKFIEYVENKELLAIMFVKYDFIKIAAYHCSFKMFQILLKFINSFENKTYLYRCILEASIVDYIQAKIRIKKLNMKSTLKLVQETINEIALSVIESREKLELTNLQIRHLKHYVQSNNYSGKNRDNILLILKEKYTETGT